MSRFFIGQRCRIIDTDRSSDPVIVALLGAEVRIVSEYSGIDGLWWELDNEILVRKSHAHEILAPILPEGSAPSEFTYTELIESLHEMTGVAA